MNKFYLLPVCLCCVLTLYAQQPMPAPFIITADTLDYQVLDNTYWQVLEDREGKWNINDVSSSVTSGGFHENSANYKKPAYPVNIYWIRFTLTNHLQHLVNIIVQQKSTYTDVYFSAGSGRWIHKKTGNNEPWSQRSGYKLTDAIPYTIQPAQSVIIYQRVAFDHRISRPKPPEAGFGFEDKMVQDNYVDNDSFFFKTILGSFFIGLLVFAAIFNFFFFLIVRERVYLYYALALLFGTINEYYNIFFHVFFREHPSVIFTNAVFFLVAVNYFAIQMERYFLNTFTHYPRWDKFLQFSIFIQFLAALAVYFAGPHLPNDTDNTIWKVWDWTQGIVLMCLLITFLLYIRKKDRSARYFIIGCLPVAIVWVVNYLIIAGTNAALVMEWNKYYDRIELLCVSSLVIILSWILFQRYNKLRKENAEVALLNERLAKEKEIERSNLIAQQKVVLEKEVAERTAELKQSLEDLKAAEKQLIQSEKMASLGELTAGIAHEIQNPLNFVNNFSEVSNELIEELQGERAKVKGERNEEIEDEIFNDIKQNLEKINHHGKRADAIVKAMLQHTSSRTGKKEPTDINSLAENYLRVCYDNFCTKDKTFHAIVKTDFDESIGKIEIVPEDIGRVLVNLYNNAFYAVSLPREGGFNKAREPMVCVTTKRSSSLSFGEGRGEVIISVKDNGSGIPHNIVDKIFQPFFTTKPTGQGTGLGLSLSYDIIKAHGGELKVESKEGEGSAFIIKLLVS